MSSFLAALEFLTRLRVRRTPRGDMAAVAAAQGWFPAVGLIIGALLLAIDRLATRALPELTVDVLLVVGLAAITGALHLDGLADAADGLLAGDTPERRLAIMRDVRSGTYAVVAVTSVLALKWAGLVALPRPVRFEALLLVPCLARFGMLVTSAVFPYARVGGTGVAFHKAASGRAILFAGATAFSASFVLLGVGGMYVATFAAIGALVFGWRAQRLVGGMTGDLYGAVIELSEAALFLFIGAMADHGWLEAWVT